MPVDLLRYDKLVEEALRGVVRTALEQVSDHGLPPGEHGLYITFRTAAVRLPRRLVETYPDEMTIVLEHQFWDLDVFEDRFEVTLSFNAAHERLSIPFDAVTAFADPKQNFGLKFETLEKIGAEARAAKENDAEASGEKIVALDAFRKK